MNKRITLLLLMILIPFSMIAQNERDFIRKGNRCFAKKQYPQAEIFFKKALSVNSNSAVASYNLGCTLQAQNKFKAAVPYYGKAIQSEKNNFNKASAYHNLGTTYQAQKEYAKAIDAYKQALRINPNHNNARYNLTMCKKMLKKQQKQNNNKNNNNRNNKNNKNDKNKQKNKQNTNPNKNNQQKQNNNMNRDNAERLLNAAVQAEKETQQKLKKYMKQPIRKSNDKNW